MTDDRFILALSEPAFLPAFEYESFRTRYNIDSIPRIPPHGVSDRSSLARAISEAVATRAATGKSPYVAFVWFFDVSAMFSPFDETMLSPLTENGGCRFFSGGGAGYDDVGVEWMTNQGAYYCNTPTAITVPTANGALMLILAATRAISQCDMYTRAGKWRGDASVPGDFVPYGQDIEGLTLGIIGLGSIGKALSVRAQACGMKIIYYNRRPVPESEATGATYVSMDELLATSDVISVNCPLTPATRHLLGPAEFDKMKTGVFIVNTARGAIIDEEALVQALKSGKVARVGLDVFEREPIIHPGLLDPSLAYRVTLQPHTTGRTDRSFLNGERQILKSLEEFMRGEKPEYAVNDPKV
ncbi:D-isomer specific 2-hydroxyacid dehydrogenase [Mycena maculata]|uniref:D-isomer specific 2-hydroxyacid dehydrogenase n=1 Tax=Mycena maculata TaxID=230809 RepID=A0AAD7JUA3_9AGAR|nr:D-isomer specific 2-hydroxyacid dehydrogenase [Mycena maculata]